MSLVLLPLVEQELVIIMKTMEPRTSKTASRRLARQHHIVMPALSSAFCLPIADGLSSLVLRRLIITDRSRENANYVLSEVKRPRGDESKTYRRGVLYAFALVFVLYILANIAYFAASSVEDIEAAGVIVAAKFFSRVRPTCPQYVSYLDPSTDLTRSSATDPS